MTQDRWRADLLVARGAPRGRALGGLLLLRLALLLQRLAGRRLGALRAALVLVGHGVSFPKEGVEATVSPSRNPFEGDLRASLRTRRSRMRPRRAETVEGEGSRLGLVERGGLPL